MKDRLTFLYMLFNVSAIDNITDVRIVNSHFETSRIIGSTSKERRNSLSIMYNKYLHKLPLEIPNKKKSNFRMFK